MMSLKPNEEATCTLAGPDGPFLVVIMITPLAPLDPYIADAEASFKTSIFAISFGLINVNASPPGVVPTPEGAKVGLGDLPSKGIPSTTYNGVLPARIELLPLIFT